MAWRMLEHGQVTWQVTYAAERRGNSDAWTLVLAFRPAAGTGHRTFWVPLGMESGSKSGLFAQAEQLTDQALAAVLAEYLG